MLKPIVTFIDYAINYDYISKVLCINKDKPEMNCNGKCYIMKQLKQQQEEDYNALEVRMEDYPIGFISLLQLNKINTIITDEKQLFFYANKYSLLFKQDIFHPPTT